MKARVPATIVLMVAMFMDLMDSTITNVALPAIRSDLHATPAQLEWTLAGYVIAFAMLLITGGRLGDIVGRRRIFVVGVIGFTIASALASMTQTGDTLVATRVVQGVFAGLMVPQVLSSVQVMFTPRERGPIFGIIGALTALGAVSGLLVGGWIVTADVWGLGWRAIFLVNVPIGVVLAIAALIVVPSSRAEKAPRLDLVGVLLASATVFLIVFPLTYGRQADWAAWIWVLLGCAPILLVVFVVQQNRRLARDGSSLLPMNLFRDRGFSAGLVVQLVSSIGNGSYALILIFYVQSALGFTALSSGLTLVPIAIGSMIASPLVVPLAKKFGRSLMLIGGMVQAVAFVWTMLVITQRGALLNGWDLVIPMAVVGVGMMFLIMPLMDLSLATVPFEDAGAASGSLTTFAQTGMVLGVSIAGAIYFGILGTHTSSAVQVHAVTSGLWVPVVAYAISGAVALAMPKMVQRDAAPAAEGQQLEEATRS
jgi:EmrB/QacA subfamily drug resistance transporter